MSPLESLAPNDITTAGQWCFYTSYYCPHHFLMVQVIIYSCLHQQTGKSEF